MAFKNLNAERRIGDQCLPTIECIENGALKILYISSEYPIPAPSGGIASVLQDLAREWVRQGHDIKIICADNQYAQRSRVHIINDCGVEIHYISLAYNKLVSALCSSPKLRYSLSWLLPDLSPLIIPTATYLYWRHLKKTWIPDVIQAHDWQACGLFFPIFERKIPFIMRGDGHCKAIVTANGHKWTPFNEAQHRIERLCAKYATLIMPCSQFLADDQIMDFQVSPEKVIVIHNCVTVDNMDDVIKTVPKEEPNETKVLFVGRLEHRKGIDLLLEAASRLHSKHPDIKLILIGSDRMNIRKYLEKCKFPLSFMKKVVIKGQIPRSDVKNWMKRCDFAVLPSRYEPFGLVFLEAMSCGIPVVVSDAGGWRETVEDGLTGFIVKSNDTKALQHAMDKMIEIGAEKRREMGQFAKDIIQKQYSPQLIAQKMVDVYNSLINIHKSSNG